MKIKLNEYVKDLENKLKEDKVDKNLPEEVYSWIQFFQHERLVHLIVTFFVGLAMVLFFIGFLITQNLLVFVLFLLLLCLFIPYIFHYYYLENNVQKLYDYYLQNKRITKK